MKNLLYSIPDNWVWTTIDEISEKPQYGWTTKASDRGDIHLLRTTDITSGFIDWDSVPYCTENPKDIEKYLLHVNDVVISRAGSVGYSYLIKNPRKSVFASYLIRFKVNINPSYFQLFLKTPYYWQSISETKLGIAIPNVNATKIKNIHFPLAPLNEQVRIVGRVEELLSRLDAGVRSLQAAQTQLEQYRQTTLKQAYTGKTTQKWRNRNSSTLSIVEDFLIQINNEGIRQKEGNYRTSKIDIKEILTEIPDNWRWTTLSNITINLDSKRIPVKKDDRKKMQGVYPYYGASGIIDYVDDYLFDGEYLLLGEDGANLIARSTPIAFIAKGKFWVNNHAHVFKSLGGIPLQFIENYLNHISLLKYVTGTAQPKLSQRNMNKIPICIPPIQEQYEIVQRIEHVFSVINKIKYNIEIILKKTTNLKNAILKKAFEGRLVSQDPHDDPASVLLGRIETQNMKQRKLI